ncbi:hypothetical protein Bateq7PJ16_3543 [Bacillus subtilis]|nr:hypothetical protein Bateq7PJ16_3543 [Bacillus subtilis]
MKGLQDIFLVGNYPEKYWWMFIQAVVSLSVGSLQVLS